MSPDFLRFADLAQIYWRERGDRTLNEAWYAWRTEDGLCSSPLKTPEHAAAKAALIEEWGAEKFDTIADLYDHYG